MVVGEYCEEYNGLIVRVIPFKELCDRHDDLMLEYDIDDMWEVYRDAGPCYEILREGKLSIVWPPPSARQSKKSG